MNILVSFELAKLLKEKGFDNNVLHFYTKPKSKMFSIDEHERIYSIKNISKKLYSVGEHFALNSNSVYPAPTLTDVVMWLYEKHRIWINIDTLGDEKIYPKWNYKLIDLKNPNSNVEWESKQLTISYEELIKNSFDSPTEAYKAAINYTLENLIK